MSSVIRISVSRWPIVVKVSTIRSWVIGRGGTTPSWAFAIAEASLAPIQIGR